MPADSSPPLAQQATIPLTPLESDPSAPAPTVSTAETKIPVPAASTAESIPPAAAASTVEFVPPALAASTSYETIRELNHGGMGVVYLVRNRRMDRLEGLKVIQESLLRQAGALPRFEREMRLAAKLNHPNIVTAYSAPELPGLLAFAMEYVEGTDLARLLDKHGPLPIGKACNYIHQAALGLQHAHEMGLVHRDIKPGNLMLKQSGDQQVIKILDFGLAKATAERPLDDRLTGTGQMMGTPHYMAPEQIADAATADIRADIYSLGCTLYHLLSGRQPFHHCKSVYAILSAHELELARWLTEVRSDVPPELATVVARMMAKSPADRYQTPGDVAKVLARFIECGGGEFVPADSQITDQSQALASTANLGKTAHPPTPPTDPKPDRGATDIDGAKTTSKRIPQNGPSPADDHLGKRRLLGIGLAVFVTLMGVFALWKNTNGKLGGDGDSTANPGADSAKSGATVTEPIQPAPDEITNKLGMKLTLIPAGNFLMGSSESPAETAAFAQHTGWKDAESKNFKDEHPQHRVFITKPFYLGTYEVTKGEFAKFVSAKVYKTEAEQDGKGGWGYTGDDDEPFKQDPKFTWRDVGFSQSDEHPVVNVNWNNAVAFCDWLSVSEGTKYRLPTEAEWEYACRAETTSRYCYGDDPAGLVQVGNVLDSPASAKWPQFVGIQGDDGYVFTAPVGRFHANKFGLYDMHGNVWEWCADSYDKDYYANSPQRDPTGTSVDAAQVHRGGSWLGSGRFPDGAAAYRAAYRGSDSRAFRSHYLGFRVVMQPFR